MSDPIDRQAAIDALCEEYCNGHHDCKYYPRCENLRWIQELPSAQPEPKWIPCEKKLPEHDGRYLCTVGAAYRNPREMYYAPQPWADKSDDATWRSTDGSYVFDWFVKAWMPLPEVYREETEDAEIH